jgi:hypothetical protein
VTAGYSHEVGQLPQGARILSALQQGWKPREARLAVRLPSRIRIGSGWADACIHNISSRGMMLQSVTPPKPGSYIEVRRGSNIIVGRVIWRRDGFFGIRTQQPIDVRALSAPPEANVSTSPDQNAAALERRSTQRLSEEARLARRAGQSSQFSRIFQFGMMVAAGFLASAIIAREIYVVLSTPANLISDAMSGRSPH